MTDTPLAPQVPDSQIVIPSIRSRINTSIQDLFGVQIPISPGTDEEEDVEIWYCVDHEHMKKAIEILRETQDRLAAAERRIADKLQHIQENY